MEASIAALSRHQISEFFSNNTRITQQQCNQEAKRITRASASPSAVQGGTSYTVVAGESVVQFRAVDCALDMELLKCVEETYAGFVPRHFLAGQVGGLHVYQMNNVGGISMYLARGQLHRNNHHLLQRTLRDYAKFFASAWHNTPEGAPPRFRQTLDYVIRGLPNLFADDWPMVPNHTDLLENNIHVDPDTGRLVGICDWKDAQVGPFGMSLEGLETMLGIRKTTGWCYHANQQALRDLFWRVFYEAIGNVADDRIEVARLAGIFLTNGWKYDDEGNKVPAWEGTHELNYLDAVVLGIQTSTSG